MQLTEEMFQRANEVANSRDWSMSDVDHLRLILVAALGKPERPPILVNDHMIRAGIDAYKFAMWRSLSYAATIEETLSYVYRSMAAKDPNRGDTRA